MRRYALDHLERIRIKSGSTVHPAVLLSLARRHGVPGWIRPAVFGLKLMPLALIANESDRLTSTPMDVLMGPETYRIYARMRESMMNKRLHLALRAPGYTHAKGCLSHKACSDAWDSAWLNTVGRKLLHPDNLFDLVPPI